MSKKGHGPKTGGTRDQNFTPGWAVDRLLDAWTPSTTGGTWLEPGAGRGNIIRAVARRLPVVWHAVEIEPRFKQSLYRAGAAVVTIANFLTEMPPQLSDVTVVLGNPPFTWAMEFITQARRLCPNAEVVLLLPLNILSSADRQAFMDKSMPDVFVLPDRPSFTSDGETDAQDYAWCRWIGGGGLVGIVKVLGLTPVKIRKGRG